MIVARLDVYHNLALHACLSSIKAGVVPTREILLETLRLYHSKCPFVSSAALPHTTTIVAMHLWYLF